MTEFVSFLVNAIELGSTYAVVAVGIVLIFTVLDVMSIAQGQILMAAAYVGLVFILAATGSVLLAAVVTIVFGFILGFALERVVVRPAMSGGHVATLVTTLGAGLVITSVVTLIWGPYQSGVDVGGISKTVGRISGVPISYAQILIVVSLLVGFGLVHWVTRRTSAGRVMRAVAENPRIASVLGANVSMVRALTFACGSALSGLAGVMLILNYGYISNQLGLTYTLEGLTAVLLGGASSIGGVAVASFALALIQVGATTYVGSGYSDLFGFAFLFFALLIRPTGLFAAPAERRAG